MDVMTHCRCLRWLPLVVVLFGGRSLVAAPETEMTWLRDARPVEVRLPTGRVSWTARMDLPADADALRVVVSGSRNVDLHLRYGRPAEENGRTTADVSAVGETPHEMIAITVASEPRLRPGAWFVTVESAAPKDGEVTFEIVAFVDRKGGRRTLLPGCPVAVTVPQPGRAFAMRTWVPRRAVEALIDLDPPVIEGLRFRLEGPGGFRRRATTQERILMISEGAPRGVYVVALSAPTPTVRPPQLMACVTWCFPDGFLLPPPASPLLEPGRPLPVLMGGPANGSLQPIRIPVREENAGFVLTAASTAGVNVDLYVSRNVLSSDRDERTEWFGLCVGPSERVVVGGDRPLAPGTYHAMVRLVDDDKPVEVIVTARPLAVGEGLTTWGGAKPLLEPDTWTTGAVRVKESALTWHAIEVPEGTEILHAQLLDATSPLELVLVSRADGCILDRAFTPLVNEYLEVIFPEPLEEARLLLLGVLNRLTWDEEVSYRIGVAFDRRPLLPDDLPWPPAIHMDALSTAERTAAATVEVTIGDCSGGSGACVTPDGLILSCRHCLNLDRYVGSAQHEGIIVAFPHALDMPPIQAYYAKILTEDPDSDLVLLVPLHDVFERPLPEDIVLPWLPLGESSNVRLGQPVWVGGYPQMGSECTRTAVILSRGIVAGLERTPSGPTWIKTDAWVAPGHSGGPLVDSQGRLVGIAAATLGRTESLGLAIPIDRVPPAWREIIRGHVEGEVTEVGDPVAGPDEDESGP